MLNFIDKFMDRNRTKMRYVVPFFCMYINFCNISYIRSSGVLYMEFIKKYNCTFAEASWTFTMATSFIGYSTCLASFLLYYVQPRNIIFTGILLTSFSYLFSAFAKNIFLLIFLATVQGTGIGFSIFVMPIIIMQYLKKNGSLGCGIAICGCNCASLVFPTLIQWILTFESLETVFYVLFLATFSAIIPSLFLITPKKMDENKIKIDLKNKQLEILNQNQNLLEKQVEDKTSTDLEISQIQAKDNLDEMDDKLNKFSFFKRFKQDLHVFCSYHYYFILIVETVFFFCFLSFMIVMQNIAVDYGLSKVKAATLSSFFAIGEFFGSLLPGLLTYYKIMSNKNIFVISMIVMGVQFCLIPIFASNYFNFAFMYTFIGGSFGCQLTLPIVILVEYLGMEKAPMAKGFTSVISSTISLTKPIYIDYVKRITGSYDYIMYINGLMCILSTIPWFIEPFIRKRLQRKV